MVFHVFSFPWKVGWENNFFYDINKMMSTQITMKKSLKGLQRDQLTNEMIFIPKCPIR